MLEEIGYEYKTTKIDLDKGEQFKPEFKKISPLSKIPVIIDQSKNKTIFESGAILMYLAEESGKFYDQNNRLEINQWLKDDTYGYCLDTAEPIGLKRLMARPVAKYTIAAQEKHEKNEKVYADD